MPSSTSRSWSSRWSPKPTVWRRASNNPAESPYTAFTSRRAARRCSRNQTPPIQEIGKLLKADPRLRLYVVGHTDNAGSLEANLKVSKERADAAVKAVVSNHGIAAARLTAFGAGL